MSTATPALTSPALTLPRDSDTTVAATARKRLSRPWASVAAVVIAVLWTIPSFGLLISSVRPERAVKTSGWWTFFTNPQITLDNYRAVLSSDSSAGLGAYFVNSFAIVIPSVVIPLVLAALAAYAFAWIEFPFRNVLFVAVFALQIVPIQVTLIPLLSLYVDYGVTGFPWPWPTSVAPGVPLGTCCPPGLSSRSSCRWWCSSACSATSCRASSPAG